MIPLPRAAIARARIVLFSVVSIGVMVFGIVGMHAGMAGTDGPTGPAQPAHSMMTTAPGDGDMIAAASAATADLMQHGMGGMSAMDCLLLGMMCVFGAIALALLLSLIARLRSLLRRRPTIRAFTAPAALRKTEPPSLLVLSISRT